MSHVKQYPRVNRIEVVDDRGRAFYAHYPEDGVELHFQDGGYTLKVFAGRHSGSETEGELSRSSVG